MRRLMIRCFSMNDLQKLDPDLPLDFDPKQVFLESENSIRRPTTKKTLARDWFQDAWKSMNEIAKRAEEEEKNQPRKSTYYTASQALMQRESTKKAKPVAVIHTKPQRLESKAEAVLKKEPTVKKKKSKKRRKSKSKVKPEQQVGYHLMGEDEAVAENAVKIKDELMKYLENPTTPLLKGSLAQSKRTASRTHAPMKALQHRDALVIVDECSESICSGLTCLDSLFTPDWSGAKNEEVDGSEDEQCASVVDNEKLCVKLDVKDETSTTEDDEEEVDSWANDPPFAEFVQNVSILGDGQSVSSSATVPYVGDDDSSLPSNRESDLDSVSTMFISSDESDSYKYPLFLRDDSEKSSYFEGQTSYQKYRRPKATNISKLLRNPSQQTCVTGQDDEPYHILLEI